MNKRSVRVRNGFSDRNNIKPISKEIITTNFPDDVRMSLSNKFISEIDLYVKHCNLNKASVAKYIVENLFNDKYREFLDTYSSVKNDISNVILENEYNEIIDLIEAITNILEKCYENRCKTNQDFCNDIYKDINSIFENEYIGYRFVSGKIMSISSNVEVKCIEQATQSKYEKVNESIAKAIGFISETGNKDYENCVKESVTAVESLCNNILGTTGLHLSNAIEQISQRINIHSDLKESIKKLYHYASDSDGVRHGNNKPGPSINFHEAKFILLTCSALVNYLSSLDLKK